MLPEWVPAYEAEHRRLTAEVREALLAVSARTLDRLLEPLRASAGRRGGTRPGSLLRQSIPIHGEWSEEGPGWVELDTVALCGGRLDDLHAWMLDVVDIRTDWTELRAPANRGQHSTLEQVRDVEKSLARPPASLPIPRRRLGPSPCSGPTATTAASSSTTISCAIFRSAKSRCW